MAVFEYKGIERSGKRCTGTQKAPDKGTALSTIRSQGIKVIALSEKSAITRGRVTLSLGRKVTGKERDTFTRQLSSLLSAGVPLAPALKRLAAETGGEQAKLVWRGIHDLVIDGVSLADAMRQYPDTFPGIYVAMVRAGETGGFIDLVLKEMAEFQEREKDLQGKVMTAMIYPVILGILCVVVVGFLMVFCIPKFEDIFSEFGAGLPYMTQLVVDASRFVQNYGLMIVVAVCAAVVGTIQWLKTERGAERWEQVMVSIPVVGKVRKQFALTRFCRMLGTLTNAGIPLLNALNVSKESIGLRTVIKMFSVSIEHVQQGSSLADGLRETGELFSGSVLEIISIAEQSGRLDEELIHLAEEIDKELDRDLRTAVSLAEPLMLFVMAAVIGTIVVAMVLPMFSMQDYIQ